jgi:hypothetical protein
MEHDSAGAAAGFSELSAADQAAIRETQKRKKLAKAEAKQRARAAKQQAEDGRSTSGSDGQPAGAAAGAAAAAGASTAAGGDLLAAAAEYPTRISLDSYFGACPGGGFRDPSLPPTEESLTLLMTVLQAGDTQAASLNTCNYFQFSGTQDALWDATFNARLAWEGFFTITTSRRSRAGSGGREPLPELQPFYGVLTWPNFYAAKHIRTHLSRMRRRELPGAAPEAAAADATGQTETETDPSGGGASEPPAAASRTKKRLYLEDCADRHACWQHLEDYHNSAARAEHGDNWLTERYFEMMVAASDDPSISYRMHTILMIEEEEVAVDEEGGSATDGARVVRCVCCSCEPSAGFAHCLLPGVSIVL